MLLETAVPAATIFGSEFLGTMILILLGCGVVANNLLPKCKGNPAPGSLQINWGWGFGVMFGVYAAYKTGGHLNPAVTIGLALAGKDLANGIPATASNIIIYILAQFAGAFVGAVLCWLAYKQHYDEACDPALKRGGPLAAALLIVSIGASLGGPTGYAINPARDLSPRIAHAVLPIKGKGGSDWGYSWVPVVGPIIGAVLAALTYTIFWH